MKQKAVKMSLEFVSTICRKGSWMYESEGAIPEDAKAVAIFCSPDEHFDHEFITPGVYVIFEHPTFEDIPEGASIPLVCPRIQRLKND